MPLDTALALVARALGPQCTSGAHLLGHRIIDAVAALLRRHALDRLPRRTAVGICRGALDSDVFNALAEVRALTDDRLEHYNHRRPQASLSRIPPKS
jgi:hypothetical protein